MAKVNHFDLPAEDAERASHFYEHIFGWNVFKVPTDAMDYWMMNSTRMDSDGKPKMEEGVINGGIYKKDNDQQRLTVYITVDSMDETIGNIESHGGRIVVPKTQVGEMGYMAHFMDTEGNMVGLWEEMKK